MDRRLFLGMLPLAGCAHKSQLPAPPANVVPRLMPIRAERDRIFRTTVCSRPFRAAGPRLEVERVGEKIVVHNYGHGGSGWSLSWGSSAIAVEKAMAHGTRDIAVIGCGALGLTSAILLQRAGAKVTIYAKERPPEVRSSRATGSWTPDSRVALSNAVSADFPALWEKMTRYSFHTYESYLGMAGNPVEWADIYRLSDGESRREEHGALPFAKYQDRVLDLTPRSIELPPAANPFPTKTAFRNSTLTFNIAGYSRQLINDFLVEGGKIENIEFHEVSELATLPQKVIVNCTGYGARALWKDESIVPVRGQIAWLIPQPEVRYGLMYNGIFVLSRRDGIVVQSMGSGEMEGYNNPSEVPDRKAAEDAVGILKELYSRFPNS